MKLKTLLQSICFCIDCNWKVNRARHLLCIYPLKYKPLNYVFNTFEEYLGSTMAVTSTEKSISKEHIEYIIKNGLTKYFGVHSFYSS